MSKMTDRENAADLLDVKQFDGIALEETSCEKVADGGCRAWTVCLATALVFGMYLGYEFNYGLIYAKLIEEYNTTANSALYAGWIGSTAFGIECLFFLPSAICIDLFGSRKVAIFGATLSTVGLLASAFVENLAVYFLTYGIMFGVGQAFVAEATYQILPHYFDKKLGLANGITVFGGAIITITLIIMSSVTIDTVGLKYAFLVLMGLSATTIIASFAFKHVLKTSSNKNDTFANRIKQSFGTDVFKRPEFIIWCISNCFGLFGFYITNVTIDHYSQILFYTSNKQILNIVYAASSGLSGLLFGEISDHCKFSHIYFHSLAFLIIGVAQIGMIFSKTFVVLVLVYALVGVGDGIYFSCITSIACEVSGSANLSNQAIGYLHLFITIPVVAGPIVAASLFEKFGNYVIAYYMSAVLSFIGCIIQLFYPGGFIVTSAKRMLTCLFKWLKSFCEIKTASYPINKYDN